MKRFVITVFFGTIFLFGSAHGQRVKELLTPEESFWLKNRNSTIVVYPEKNYPPFSYQDTSGTPHGLSIDYIELAAEKIGATISYLPSRQLSQILDDVQQGKGDVITSLADTSEREGYLLFTDSYITVPAVIVVRKDLDDDSFRTPSDLIGKKIAIGDGYAVMDFIRKNYPRIVLEPVSDDEVALQKVVLGEVDAAIMDVASLSFYLSKQVLNSVSIAGNTGFDYKLAFAVPRDQPLLQSILDKGLSQISINDRQILTDKWITLPNEINTKNSSWWRYVTDQSGLQVAIAVLIGVVIVLFALVQHRHIPYRYFRRKEALATLHDEVSELEYESKQLVDELEDIKQKEELIKEKIKEME